MGAMEPNPPSELGRIEGTISQKCGTLLWSLHIDDMIRIVYLGSHPHLHDIFLNFISIEVRSTAQLSTQPVISLAQSYAALLIE